MTEKISRSDMFELVWTEPRTKLAKRFKISDVAIGKHCRRANIPMPPPGYWTRSQTGKASARPMLPMRLPGQRDQVFPTEEERLGFYGRTVNLDEVLEPPVFHEAADLLVADAAKRIGKVQACRDLGNPHEGLRRLLADEAQRREAWKSQKFSDYYKPHFDELHFQRQLRLINSLLWAFARIDCKGQAYAREEWLQGVGTLHFLHCHICIGTTNVGFAFLEPTTPKTLKKVSPTGRTTLRISADLDDDLDWRDQPDKKLEKQLTAVCFAMLEVAEKRLRQSAMQAYEWKAERRQEVLDSIARKKADDERGRLNAIAEHRQANRDALIKMANEHRVANEMRDFVDAVRKHSECSGSNLALFSEWERQVIGFADSFDPLIQPLTNILAAFSEYPAQAEKA